MNTLCYIMKCFLMHCRYGPHGKCYQNTPNDKKKKKTLKNVIQSITTQFIQLTTKSPFELNKAVSHDFLGECH